MTLNGCERIGGKPLKSGWAGLAVMTLVLAVLLAAGTATAGADPAEPEAKIDRIRLAPGKAGVMPTDRKLMKVTVRNSGTAAARNVTVRIWTRGATFHQKRLVIKYVPAKRSVTKPFRVGIRGWASGRIPVVVGTHGLRARSTLRLLDSGPCVNPKVRKRLLCPDIRVAPPRDMWSSTTSGGRTLLRSTNDIRNVGMGPLELRGRRDRASSMATTQAIKMKGGGWRLFPSQMRLSFHNSGGYGSWWKASFPLRFELWKVNRKRKRTRLVRTGPKQYYCLRDGYRTVPGPRARRTPLYPACNQDPNRQRVTLGISVGWSDIYPSTYSEQYINVTGLKGCFAYVLRANPHRRIVELNSRNNVSQRIVRLPWTGSSKGC